MPTKPEAGAAAELRVVLVGPKRGANVGAVCRAAKNMGAGPVVVVGEEFDASEARRTAVHAADVFDARRSCASLEEAVADCAVVVGTTSRTAPWKIPVRPVAEVMAELFDSPVAPGAVALVFGPEDRGLGNEELSRCHRLVFVPTAAEYVSLNLAQAAVVCLYESWLARSRAGRAAAAAPPRGSQPSPEGLPPAADHASVSAALADLREVLAEIGFLDGDQSERVMATVASMLTRGGLDAREVRILRGIARQVRWAARRA